MSNDVIKLFFPGCSTASGRLSSNLQVLIIRAARLDFVSKIPRLIEGRTLYAQRSNNTYL